MGPADSWPPFSLSGATPAGPADLTPPVVANYELVRLIGVGGMGAVFEAWQQKPSRRVALKVLHANLLIPAFLHRFRQEADILARLEHPLIARIYDVSSTSGPGPQRPVLAMEYIEGVALDEYVREKPLSASARLLLLRDLIQAVHVAHQRGVIHGDLKPANIRVDADGRPRILDFGLARWVEDAGSRQDARPSGLALERVGTPPYMSPEMRSAPEQPIDVRCDVYALGVIASEVLAGHRDVGKWTGTPERAQGVDADCAWILRMATAPDPDCRYPSAASFADDLGRLLTHTPIRARPRTATYVLRMYATRHKVLATAASIAVASIVAGSTAAVWSLAEARRAQVQAEEQRQQAESHLRQTLQTVDQFMTLLSRSQLALVPEAGALRRQLFLNAVGFLGQLAEQHPDDPAMAHQKSWAMSHLATDYVAAGEIANAEAIHHQAIAFLTAFSERNQDDPDATVIRNKAHHWDELGNLLSQVARHRDALAAFREALAIKQTLVQRAPENIAYARDLARTWDDMGSLYMSQQRYPDAITAFAVSTEIKRHVALAEPHVAEYQRRLALSHAALGRAQMRRGQPAEALQSLQQAQSVFQGIAVPALADYSYDLARFYGELGQAHAALEQWDEAHRFFAEGDRLYRHILAQEPDYTDAMMGHAYLLGFWSETLTGDSRTARLEQAQHLWLQLQNRRPRSSAVQRALRWVQTRLGHPDHPEDSLTTSPRDPDSPTVSDEGALPPVLQAGDTQQLRAAAGSIVRVQGRVQRVVTRVGTSELSFIHFGTLRGHFSGVIHINSLPAFEALYGPDLADLIGKEILLHGMLSIHNQTPQMILNRSDQVLTPPR